MKRLTFLVLLAFACESARATGDADAAARASLARIEALLKERPGDGLLKYYQALAHLRLGERKAAYELLRGLADRKLGLVPVREFGFASVWQDPEFQKIRDELVRNEPRTPPSPVAFRLTDPKLIPEGIAYDATGDRFFIGSTAQRTIIVTDGRGRPRDFSGPEDGLEAVLGLTIDPARGHLYAVSTNGFFERAKTERRNEVVRYDLKSGRVVDRFSAPEARQLNDLVVAADGTLLA